ncbi:MAG: fibronectin type III domain-containing protein [Coriobacteriia bacterium]|nr:fibronectin type III domain-containing protein [Coriobacteriia bacterium]
MESVRKKWLPLAFAVVLAAGLSSAAARPALAAVKAPSKATISSVKAASSSKVTVTVKKQSKVSGYQFRVSTKSTMSKAKVITTTRTSATFAKLGNYTKYYAQVRAYKKSGGKRYYGAWSTKKAVRTLCAHPASKRAATTKAATCTTTGSKRVYCKTCSKTLTTSAIRALGHTYSIIEDVEATCTEEGYYIESCVRCKHKEKTEMTALGHAYALTAERPATCTEDGLRGYTCNRCSHSYTETDTKLGHAYEVTAETPATCTEEGQKTYTCSRCDDSYSEATTSLGHDYSVTNERESTCNRKGYEIYECSRCKDSYTEELELRGWHAFFTVAEGLPTCEEGGWRSRVCADCYIEDTEQLRELGHDYSAPETVAATCVTEGYSESTCSRCGDVQRTKTGDALGHKTLVQTTVDGQTYWTCTRCEWLFNSNSADDVNAASKAAADLSVSVKGQLSDYSWKEIKQISDCIAERSNAHEGLIVARAFHLVSLEGKYGLNTKDVIYNGNDHIPAFIVGVRCDKNLQDEYAGLTFGMLVEPLDQKQMYMNGSNQGGWYMSDIRIRLESYLEKFEDDVKSNVMNVVKSANSVGRTDQVPDVTSNVYKLWCPSASEIYGTSFATDDYKVFYSMEGDQFPLFKQLGVTADNSLLAASQYTFWTRSAKADTSDSFWVVKGTTGVPTSWDVSDRAAFCPCFSM